MKDLEDKNTPKSNVKWRKHNSDIVFDKQMFDEFHEEYDKKHGTYGHMILRFKPNPHLLHVSDNILSILGYNSKGEFIKTILNNLQDIIHPDDYNRVLTSAMMISLSDQDYDCSFRVKDRNGKYLWVAKHITYVEDCRNQKYIYCTFFNLSEKIRQKEWIGSMLYNIPIGMFGIDKRDGQTMVVFASEKLLYPGNLSDNKTTLIDQWMERVFASDRKVVKEALNGMFDHKKVYAIFRYCVKNENNCYIWIKAYGESFTDENGIQKEVIECRELNDLDQYEVRHAQNKFEDEFQQMSADGDPTTDQMSLLNDEPYDFNQTHGVEGDNFTIFEYDIEKNMLSCYLADNRESAPVQFENIPDSLVSIGVLDKDNIRQCERFFECIRRGQEHNRAIIRARLGGRMVWCQLACRTQYANNGKPISAMGYCIEITGYKQLEKDYLSELDANMTAQGYSLLLKARINITRNFVEYSNSDMFSMNIKHRFYTDVLRDILNLCVSDEHKKAIIYHLSLDQLKSNYKKGRTQYSFNIQLYIGEKAAYWVKITVRIYHHPNSHDLMGYVYIYNIQKEMLTQEISSYVLKNNYEYVGHLNTRTGQIFFVSYNENLELESNVVHSYDNELKRKVVNYVLEGDRKKVYDSLELNTICNRLSDNPEYSCEQYLFLDHGLRIKKWQFRYLDNLKRCIIVTRQDVTCNAAAELKRNQQLSRALLQANAANAAKSEFLSRMSHDIRTPLNSIINLTKLALMDKDNQDQMIQNLEQVSVASEFLLGMMNDILDMSKIEHGQMDLKPSVYQYSDFVTYIKAVIYPLCQKKNITFHFDIGEEAYNIYVDITRFNQIFFNVLSNAVKYTPEGGEVSCRITNKTIVDDMLYCDFIISDNGVGMSKEFVHKAFQPFEQEIHTGKSYEGSGLGLSIVKSIVDRMHGKIKIKSELGVGTEVFIRLRMPLADKIDKQADLLDPQVESTPVTAKEEKSEQDILKGKHVLIVEDYKPNSLIVSKILELYGMTSDWVENGKKAVDQYEKCQDQTYDLILMDIRMPVMDGLTATKLIRSSTHEHAAIIPIVAMTADVFGEDRKKALDCGISDYLTKPIDMDRMKAIMIEQLEAVKAC